MPIVPAREDAYRLRIRRRLTLDVFTRYGTFWTAIANLRDVWKVTPVVAVPPEPPFHAELVGLFTRYQMPERFHMPETNLDALPPETVTDLQEIAEAHGIEEMDAMLAASRQWHLQTRVWIFLSALRGVWRAEIPEDVRNGTNITGWMSWTPFLSACVLYDPPADRLLDFADHDDDNAAALPQATLWQDAEAARCSGVLLARSLDRRDAAAGRQSVDVLRESFIPSDNAPMPRSKVGQQTDELRDVQCAIWRQSGQSPSAIGSRVGLKKRPYRDSYGVTRMRPEAAEKAIKRGERILRTRGMCDSIVLV